MICDTIMMLDIIKREYMYTIWRKDVLNTERKQTHFVWPIFCSCATLPSIWATYFQIPITWSHQGPQKNLILAKYDSSIINCEQCYCPLFATGGHCPYKAIIKNWVLLFITELGTNHSMCIMTTFYHPCSWENWSVLTEILQTGRGPPRSFA